MSLKDFNYQLFVERMRRHEGMIIATYTLRRGQTFAPPVAQKCRTAKGGDGSMLTY